MAARRFYRVGVFGVAAAALLLAAAPILAQKGGGGGRGGGGGGSRGGGGGVSRGGSGGVSRGSGMPSGGGRSPSGSAHHGDHGEHRDRDHFRGYYPGFYGFYGFYGPWYYPDYYYGDYVAPRYYVPGEAFAPVVEAPPAQDTSVHMHVLLPTADAEVWFEDEKTTQTGNERDFDSPELAPGKPFIYEIRARWKEDGRERDQARKIIVYAGQKLLLDFTQPLPRERVPMPRPQEKTMPQEKAMPKVPD